MARMSYTEHVDNNAYSNYLSWYISSRAIGVYHKISEKLRQEICEKLEEPNLLAILMDFTQKDLSAQTA